LTEKPFSPAPVNDSPKRVLLLDTSAFIMGYEATDVEAEHYTVPQVLDELREGGLARVRFESAVMSGRLRVMSPDPGCLEELRAVTAVMGEAGVLSEADEQLLALGIQLKSESSVPIVVSDDYSVQNVASKLGLGFRSLATPGIKRRFEWVVYCPGCNRTFDTARPGGMCPICGTELKRKPSRKEQIR
jgi:UPF0271 protein